MLAIAVVVVVRVAVYSMSGDIAAFFLWVFLAAVVSLLLLASTRITHLPKTDTGKDPHDVGWTRPTRCD